jgi:multiple sugar transport system ATP-binding protein
MATLVLEDVTKVYPNGTVAVDDLGLEVDDGEFMVLVGPSGCGKTTALRMVAGLEEITSGTVRIGDDVVNDEAPGDRDVAMVFQNYALYPHMTVADNIGFALKIRRMPKEEIEQRVHQAARVLGLTEQLQRKPGQLSGGQRQRVAMGRAIVREPRAFLMDEPLSNLDAKLRVQMRGEIQRIQRRLGVATLYVTHDQIEAMTMGDRVAVLRAGKLQQVDPPRKLYDAPTNLFVAAFIGSPAMNLFEARVSADASSVRLGEQELELPAALQSQEGVRSFADKDVVVGIRPEDFEDASRRREAPAGRRLAGDVDLVEALGPEQLVYLRIGAPRVETEDLVAGEADADETGVGESEITGSAHEQCVARVAPTSTIEAGARAEFVVDVDRLHLFDPSTGDAIRNATP